MSEQLIPDPPLSVSPADTSSTSPGQAPIPAVPPATEGPMPYIYIGPYSPQNGLSSLAIYTELPQNIQDLIAANPAMNRLFIPLDQWRSVKPEVMNSQGNMSFTGAAKHAVDFLKSKGVL